MRGIKLEEIESYNVKLGGFGPNKMVYLGYADRSGHKFVNYSQISEAIVFVSSHLFIVEREGDNVIVNIPNGFAKFDIIKKVSIPNSKKEEKERFDRIKMQLEERLK